MTWIILIAGLVVVGLMAAGWRRERRRRAAGEAAAAARDGDLQAVLNSLGSGLLLVDRRGDIRTVSRSAAAIVGVRRHDLTGVSVNEAFPAGWHEFTRCIVQVLTREESVEREEVRIVDARGDEIPVGMTVNPIYDGAGGLDGAVAIFQDLSDVERMRARVREADRLAAVGELAASIAHEVRNPLGSIRGSAEILEGELRLDETQERLFGLILRESGRVNFLIQDFLDYARVRPVQPRPVTVREYLDDILLQVHAHLDGTKKAPELVARVEPEDLVLLMDEQQMRQVLLNLCLNALEWSGDEGVVELAAELDAAHGLCSIAVRDDGPGIAPELLETLFMPFVTGREGGNGLGLATVQRIVRAHGGDIEAVNRETGGAEFVVSLPLFGSLDGPVPEGSLDEAPVPCLVD